MTHGIYIRDGKWTRVLVLDRDLRHHRAEGLPDREARKLRSLMVILDEDETPVTAYYPSMAKVQKTRRLTKGLVRGG
jgi:hypothetical protein